MSNCSWLNCAWPLAISGKRAEHARCARELAPGAGEVGRRLARLASLLVDAHDIATSDEAIDALFAEVRRNKSRFALYRISLDVVVAALQGAERPEEALQFLREAAQLDMSLHAGRDELCIARRHQRQALGA